MEQKGNKFLINKNNWKILDEENFMYIVNI
jgi:hypothetical protein